MSNLPAPRQPLVQPVAGVMPTRAAEDTQVIRMWLHGKSENTRREYERDVLHFLEHAGCGLRELALEDVQAYAEYLGDPVMEYAPSTQARKIKSVKSLLTFAHEIGYLPFNIGRPVKAPKTKNRLAERILSESTVQRMIALEPEPRNQILLRLLYAAGLRVSEVISLRWRDTAEREKGGQITVWGKGDKTRHVRLSAETWEELRRVRAGAGDAAHVFAEGDEPLSRFQVYRIVRAAAQRAVVGKNVSPHWMRHAHASHALDRGAPVHLVKDTLGHASLTTTSKYAHARPDDSSSLYLAV